MANETVPTDWSDYIVRSLRADRYWKCNDTSSTQVVLDQNDIQPPINLTGVGVRTFDNEPLAAGLVGRSLYFPLFFNAGFFTTNLAQNSYTVAGWFNFFNATGSGANQILWYGRDGVSIQLNFNRAASNAYQLDVYNATSGTTYTLPFFSQTNPVHLAVVVNANPGGRATATIYQNGFVVTPTSVNLAAIASAQEFLQVANVALQELAVYPRQLSTSEILLLTQIGSSRLPETVTARLNRLLATTDFLPSMTSFDSSPVASVSEIGTSNGVIPEMHRVVDSEDGNLFVSASGVLTFVDRYNWSENPRSNTSQVTFADTGTAVYYDAGAVRLSVDADAIRNDSTVTFSGNGASTSIDTVSVSEYGAASESVSTFLPDPTSAQTLADYRVSIFKNPKLRVEPFLVKGQRNPSYDWPLLLNLELLDRFTFVRTPSVGSAIQKDMLLQSIEHRITPGTWETTINGSARYTGWFILGVSLLGSTEDVLL
jgi:hypothetical protein